MSTALRPTSPVPQSEEFTSDVVVVGGGIAGASVAYELATSLRVVLVEQEPQLGYHSTGRSAAVLNQTSGAVAVGELARRSEAFLRTPPAGFTDGPLLTPRGLLWVGHFGTSDLLDQTCQRAPAATRRLDLAGVQALVPSLTAAAAAAGGAHEPSATTIDVAALLDGYRRGARERGASLLMASEAVHLERRDGTWHVSAGGSRVRSRFVVDAAGAWGDILAARAGISPLGLQPLRRTAAVVNVPDADPSWPMVIDVGGHWYAEPEHAGLLVSSADETPMVPGDVRPEELDVALAIERVNEAFGLAIRSVRRAWAGLRTFTADRVPAAGPDPDQPTFVWLVGQGGAGIKTAPALAKMVADSIVYGSPIPREYDPARFR